MAQIEELAARVKEARELRHDASKQLDTLPAAFLDSVFNCSKLSTQWPSRSLPEVASIARGKFTHRPRNEPRFYGGSYPFIQIGDISSSLRYVRKYTQTLNESGLKISRLFPAGTVVIAITGATIGATAILTFDSCFPDSIVGIQAKPEFTTPEFIYLAVEYAKKTALAEATQSTQPNINLGNLERLQVRLPPVSEQHRIVTEVGAMQAEIDILRSLQSETALEINALLPAILDRAFKGKL